MLFLKRPKSMLDYIKTTSDCQAWNRLWNFKHCFRPILLYFHHLCGLHCDLNCDFVSCFNVRSEIVLDFDLKEFMVSILIIELVILRFALDTEYCLLFQKNCCCCKKYFDYFKYSRLDLHQLLFWFGLILVHLNQV